MNFKIFYLNFNLMEKYNKKNKDIKNKKLSTDDKLIYSIIKHINSNDNLRSKFNHYNNKYKLEDLLKCILFILKTGISFRNISNFTNINWNTVYKFNCKLKKYNVVYDTYSKCLNKYLNELNKYTSFFYTDTTFVCNKLGIDHVSFNQQIKKHKTTKISIISDEFNIPISVVTTTGSIHDSIILNNQLDILNKEHPILFNEKKIILADAAYDSLALKDKVNNLKLGKLITPINPRNSKNKIEDINLYNKLVLKKRINIEHTINNFKQFRRCQLRYDKYIKTFNLFVYLASLRILIKNSSIYLNY